MERDKGCCTCTCRVVPGCEIEEEDGGGGVHLRRVGGWKSGVRRSNARVDSLTESSTTWSTCEQGEHHIRRHGVVCSSLREQRGPARASTSSLVGASSRAQRAVRASALREPASALRAAARPPERESWTIFCMTRTSRESGKRSASSKG
eukprot:3574292-Prymnesium_polylepis.2